MSKTSIDNDIFSSIKKALQQEKSTSTATEILKTEVGNTYIVRLLPAKDPAKTFFHYFQHGWESLSTGQYVSALSLQTFGERDPIADERYKIIKNGTEEEKAKANLIKRAEKWLVNVLVVTDPKTPENNGKVKILRYGKQIQTIIKSAIDGEDAEDFGPRIFDLSANGVNLKIKVTEQGDFPTYVESKFSLPVEIAGLDDTKIAKIKESVFDLEKVFPTKSVAELKAMLNEHFFTHVDGTPEAPDIVPGEVAPKKEKKVEKKADAPAGEDPEIAKLLADLNVGK